MEKPIIASFRWSKEEFLRAQRHAVRGHWLFLFMPIMGSIIVLSGIVSFSFNPTKNGFFAFAFTVCFASFFFAIPIFARRSAIKMFRQMPDRDMIVTWEVSSDRVISQTELARAENSWDLFTRVLRFLDGFILFRGAAIFHWLSVHAFQDPGDVERFANLAKSKIKQYQIHV